MGWFSAAAKSELKGTQKEFLEKTGEFIVGFDFLSQPFAAYQNKELSAETFIKFATEALLFYYHGKADEKLEKAIEKSKNGPPPAKNYSIVIYAKEIVDNKEVFAVVDKRDEELYQDAESWGCRRIYEIANGSHVEIANNKGEKVITSISRIDAMRKINKRYGHSTMCKRKNISTSKLGFGVKAGNSKSDGPWNY
jgi:hypothetical protein